jgi:crotonobetainyl-CoA:carnitine CoA-transferase CaiB-like acyl-CoA transferase
MPALDGLKVIDLTRVLARRNEAGYDPVLQPEAGVMDITGPADGEPSRVGVAITDFLAGQFMFSARARGVPVP